MKKDLRQHVIGFPRCYDRQYVVYAVIPEEILDFPLHPDGLFGLRRADDDQVISIFERITNNLVEVTCDFQLTFVKENALYFVHPGRRPDFLGNPVILELTLESSNDLVVPGVVIIRNKSVIVGHGILPESVELFTHGFFVEVDLLCVMETLCAGASY